MNSPCSAVFNPEDLPETSNEETGNKRKQSELLLEYLHDVVFFHDEKRQSYAAFKVNNHTEIWPIHSKSFKAWLSHLY